MHLNIVHISYVCIYINTLFYNLQFQFYIKKLSLQLATAYARLVTVSRNKNFIITFDTYHIKTLKQLTS